MVEMKVYRCNTTEDNPMPVWMLTKPKQAEPEAPPLDLVAQFKQNPDAFFPDFLQAK